MTIKTLSGRDALDNRHKDKQKSTRFPLKDDRRIIDGLIYPDLAPSFSIPKGGTVFTIGSCFAREIEEQLDGVRLPTTEIEFSTDSVSGRPNSLLNEYNPASMAQRITWAVDGTDTRGFAESLIGTPERSQDLLLSKGLPLDVDRLLGIRKLIDDTYLALPQSDVLILTLSMTMVWKDLETGHFLNKMPDPKLIRRTPNRYIYQSLDMRTVVDLIAHAIEKLKDTAIKNVLLTVSPVPLQGTFFPEDCVISNGNSKATLRCAADEIMRLGTCQRL